MSSRVPGFLILALLVISATAYWEMARRDAQRPVVFALPAEEDSAPKGQAPAPRIKAQDEKGAVFDSASLDGRPYFVHFWATWCPPCAEELPALAAYAKRARKLGVVPVFVSVDSDWAKVRSFLAEKRVDLGATVSLLDPDSRAARLYGADRFPETFFVTADGKIARRFIGAQPWASQEALEWLAALK